MTTKQEFKYLGSVCSGSHRARDVIPALYRVLEDLAPTIAERIQKDYAALWDDKRNWSKLEDELPEEVDHLTNELFDNLDLLAPPGYRFGAHEGDGADFGYWKTDDEEE